MIIPIRCMNCGNPIADKWRYYQQQINAARLANEQVQVYFNGTTIPETAEKRVLDAMGIRRPCCRKHFLTQVDLLDKI